MQPNYSSAWSMDHATVVATDDNAHLSAMQVTNGNY